MSIPNQKKCDVTALKICVDKKSVDKKEYTAVSIQNLGLFDEQAPNRYLKNFFREYLNEIYSHMNVTDNKDDNKKIQEEKNAMNYPLNQILYGPPGTGKTYNTICYALSIIDDVPLEEMQDRMKTDKQAVFARYQKLLNVGRIVFTTFHQSMGYEEFIEGIRPVTTDTNDVKYDIKPGIFKEFCNKAKILRSSLTDQSYFFSGSPTIWKVSLAGTGKNPVRQECMYNEHIRIGWDEYGEELTDETDFSKGGKYILDAFINGMRRGDIVLSCFSANSIDAIGVVTGDYEWHDEYSHYKRLRKVKWIVKDINYDIVSINDNKQMTLSTVYKLNIPIENIINIINLYSKESSEAYYDYPSKYVFIIDEINRGNIAKIFGELITLLEDTKRLGNEEQMTCVLPYSRERFGVPKNVYILGTMNTADRSLVQLDTALRRRFTFIGMMPNADLIPVTTVDGINVKEMLQAINLRICALVDREHQIGHAYFMGLSEQSTVKDIADIFRGKILPLLQEYFYDDYAAIRTVLSGYFIKEKPVVFKHGEDEKTIYEIVIPETAEAYRSIYE